MAYRTRSLSVSAFGTSSWSDTIDRASREVLRARSVASATLVAATLAGSGASALAASFPAEVELSTLAGGDGSTGFVLNGIDADDGSGFLVSAAGDVNSDGIGDLIVGAFGADPGGRDSAGESYVVFGREAGTVFPAEIELSSLQIANGGDGSEGFVLNGIDANDYVSRVSSAGDVNGDGVADLIVGAIGADPGGRDSAGESYVVFGRVSGTAFPAEIELSGLQIANGGDGSEGFVLNGIDAGDSSGLRVSAADDVNGDGIDDLIVGAFRADPGGRNSAGESYVVFGREAGTVFPAEIELSSLQIANGGDGSEGFVLNGIDANDESGRSVSAAGDVNGDGIGDIIVGALFAEPGGRFVAGESYVVFGRPAGTVFPAEIELSSLQFANGGDGSAGFVLNGIADGDGSGLSVSAAGDVNGDGIGDIIVGAVNAYPGGRDSAGESYVVFGRVSGTAFPAEIELSGLQVANGGDGSTGFVLNGIDANDRSGRSVSAAGDVNGDGIEDLIIGADFANSNAGQSYVVFGRASGTAFPAEIELSSLQVANGGDGSTGFVLNGIDAGDGSGFPVSAAGDVNDDGIDDLIVGAYQADPGGRDSAGESYVLFGRTATPVDDMDGDGVSNDVDDCTQVANPTQRDTDADGIGNMCDPDVAVPNDCIVNFLDLNVYRANFFQAGDLDTDNNGDGQTNFLDLNIVRNYFFGPPGPSATGCN